MNWLLNPIKVSKSQNDIRFAGACSDDRVDIRNTRLSMQIFEEFIAETRSRGMPFLNVAHYPDGRIGICDQMWVDGRYLKISGHFDESELAGAAVESLLRDRSRTVPEIRQSVGFYPSEVTYEDDVLVYLSGWLEHSALTTIPVNPRTDMRLVLRGAAMTMLDDATRIVGEMLACGLDKKYRKRKARVTNKGLLIPDLPLGAKAETILEALCEQIAVPVPIVVFSDHIVEPPSDKAPRPMYLGTEAARWLEGVTGEQPLGGEPLASLVRALVLRQLGTEVELSDADIIELMSRPPSYAYLARLVALLKDAVDRDAWEEAHKLARSYAGGKGSPVRPTAISVDEFNAEPNSKPSELTDSTKLPTLARALLAIVEANEETDLPAARKQMNVSVALDDFHRSLLARMKKSKSLPPEVVEQSSELVTDEDSLLGKIGHERLSTDELKDVALVDSVHTEEREKSLVFSLDKPKHLVLAVAMEPGEDLGNGVIADEELCAKACTSFDKAFKQIWLNHHHKLARAEVIDSYCTGQQRDIDDEVCGRQFVAKGAWMVLLHVDDPEVWAQIESGELRGVSPRGIIAIEEATDA